MMKITLLVPDSITYVKGSSENAVKTQVPTTAETVIQALCMDDYHMNYYFEDEGKVKVVEIEEAEEG